MVTTTNITGSGTQTKNIWRIGMLPILGWWIKTTVHFILSNKHSPLHHSNSWELSYPCCPTQRIFPPSAIQTLVSLSSNNWSLGWSCYPACRCNLLDVFGSRTLESLSIHEGRRLHNRLCIVWSFSVYNDGHKRGPTSRHVVGTEIQRDCNFEAHVYHFSYRLGCMSYRWFILSSRSPYYFLVQPYKYIILPGNLSRLIHKNFSRSQSSSGSNTISCSTTTGPTKCTEHSAIQKGSAQCTVGTVSFSCLLCTTIYDANCNLS